ncbi:MAG: nitrite/sulfite reductase, partial [Geminicoccaceae bacterium]
EEGGPRIAPNPKEVARIQAYFAPPTLQTLPETDPAYETARAKNPAFQAWTDTNLAAHRQPGYAIVTVSLKAIGKAPGDATSDQMRTLADLAERFSLDELRISHEQNVVLPHVRKADLPAVYRALKDADLHTANIGLISDIIACPGMDYCALATARSIPIAQDIAQHFSESAYAEAIGDMKIKISGCINACGHHHVGHIGILGLEKGGRENYQITLGGDHTETLAIGERAGPGFDADQVVPAIERLIEAYLERRLSPKETFLMAFRRLGKAPFKRALYPELETADAA